MKTPKEVTLNALQCYKGDDLERAEHAFKHHSEDELDQQYGASGQTCREILDGYREAREEINNAINWVKTL